MSSLYEQLRIRFYIHQNLPGDDFWVSKVKVKQACLNKPQYSIVRSIGAFTILEYHHRDTDAFAPIQYIIRSESVRFPQDLTDAAFGAASSIRNRTNLGVLSNEHVHKATHVSQFQPHASKHIEPLLDQDHLPRMGWTGRAPAPNRSENELGL
jgi:hypothetical protein